MLGEILIALAILTVFCLSGSSVGGGGRTGYYDETDGYAQQDDNLFDDD